MCTSTKGKDSRSLSYRDVGFADVMVFPLALLGGLA